MTIKDQIQAVLGKHPLKAGEGFYKGQIICGGCHRCLMDPAQHLTEALTRELDPFWTPPTPKSEATREDPRESYTVWRSEAS